MVGVVPRLTGTPGHIDTAGPVEVGAHNEEIYCGRLGLSRDEMQALTRRGVI
jgi:crotonobetainyl-CoA:carnitine CoA-transferase CaiB-like acyl-CoA transferase